MTFILDRRNEDMNEILFLSHQMNDEEFEQWMSLGNSVANQCKKMKISEQRINQILQRFSDDRSFDGIEKNSSKNGEHYKLVREKSNKERI